MIYTSVMLGEALERELKSGYDVVKIARMAFNVYHDHGRDLSPDLDEILLSLMAMEEGPEFEFSNDELWDLRKKLASR
ncbi:hypothetical protein JCM14469_42610 [Desulfatiferula olefinivorans]